MNDKPQYILLNVNEIKFIQQEITLLQGYLKDLEKYKNLSIQGDDCSIKYGIDFLLNSSFEIFNFFDETEKGPAGKQPFKG